MQWVNPSLAEDPYRPNIDHYTKFLSRLLSVQNPWTLECDMGNVRASEMRSKPVLSTEVPYIVNDSFGMMEAISHERDDRKNLLNSYGQWSAECWVCGPSVAPTDPISQKLGDWTTVKFSGAFLCGVCGHGDTVCRVGCPARPCGRLSDDKTRIWCTSCSSKKRVREFSELEEEPDFYIPSPLAARFIHCGHAGADIPRGTTFFFDRLALADVNTAINKGEASYRAEIPSHKTNALLASLATNLQPETKGKEVNMKRDIFMVGIFPVIRCETTIKIEKGAMIVVEDGQLHYPSGPLCASWYSEGNKSKERYQANEDVTAQFPYSHSRRVLDAWTAQFE